MGNRFMDSIWAKITVNKFLKIKTHLAILKFEKVQTPAKEGHKKLHEIIY